MIRYYLTLSLLLFAGPLYAAAEPAATSTPLRVALLRTAIVPFSPEAVVTAGGSWLRNRPTIHTAILVQHPKGNLLFDAGLGSRIDEEARDMPWWAKPLLQHQREAPARQQLDAAGIQIEHIFLSHGHWDHMSGVRDFPQASVWLPAAEQDYIRRDTPPRVFQSIAADPVIRWQTLNFESGSYQGFASSHDVFGDGSVVLVPTPGHTPGATSMFVNLTPQRRLFFVGDAVWRLREVQEHSHKAWPAHYFADQNRELTDRTIQQISEVLALPGMSVIPTHDLEEQEKLGFFPHWIE